MPVDLSSRLSPQVLQHIQFIENKIRSKGHIVYLVGGCVRDLALGKTPKDIDLATSATPSEVKSIFSHVIETGILHGTVTVMLDRIPYEVTTFRTESGYIDGRRPGQVTFASELSEDLKRRDFTINALAVDISTGSWIDEHQGMNDIEAKLIRCVGNPLERFSEDGLRPIRALRFASSLGFTIEHETRESISRTRSVIQKISIERLLDEIRKAFQGKDPETFVRLLLEEDILPLFFPFWKDTDQEEAFISALNSVPKSDFSLFLFFLSQGLAQRGELLLPFLKSLKTSHLIEKDCIQFQEIQSILKNHKFSTDYELKKSLLSPLAKFASQANVTRIDVLRRFFPLWENRTWVLPEYNNSSFSNRLSEILNQNPPLILRDLEINGNQILESFPDIPREKIGRILQELLDRVWENPEQNTLSYLIQQSAEELSKLQ